MVTNPLEVVTGEQGRWQTELAQAAVELIAIVTNSGRASTLAATDAGTPTLRRIERAAIAAACYSYFLRRKGTSTSYARTPSGLWIVLDCAATPIREAQFTPLPSLAAPSPLANRISAKESSTLEFQWPCGRVSNGFLCQKTNDVSIMLFLPSLNQLYQLPAKRNSNFFFKISQFQVNKINLQEFHGCGSLIDSQTCGDSSTTPVSTDLESPLVNGEFNEDVESKKKNLVISPLKRKLSELKHANAASSPKRQSSDDSKTSILCWLSDGSH